jgi:hypothetical protein
MLENDIRFFMGVGYLLVFVTTTALFIAYAATEQASYNLRRGPIPMVSDMFGDWPIPSSATMGMGTALLYSSVLLVASTLQTEDVRWLVGYCIGVQASLWILISTGTKNGYTPIVVTLAHALGAFLFTLFSVMVLRTTHKLCKLYSVVDNAKLLSIAPVCVNTSLVAIVLSVVFMGVSTVLSPDTKKLFVWPLLASFELFISFLTWVGFTSLMYAYYAMRAGDYEPLHL